MFIQKVQRTYTKRSLEFKISKFGCYESVLGISEEVGLSMSIMVAYKLLSLFLRLNIYAKRNFDYLHLHLTTNFKFDFDLTVIIKTTENLQTFVR